ncbi:unnamed protein product [Musa acuminata subsp. burmannicoides]
MTGKAKPKKHTAKEIAGKIDAATTNRGGGKAGQSDRSGQDKGGHAKLECPLCKITAPDVKSMQIHHDSRHPKIPSTSPSSSISTPPVSPKPQAPPRRPRQPQEIAPPISCHRRYTASNLFLYLPLLCRC